MTLGHEWHEMMSDQNPAGGWTNQTPAAPTTARRTPTSAPGSSPAPPAAPRTSPSAPSAPTPSRPAGPTTPTPAPSRTRSVNHGTADTVTVTSPATRPRRSAPRSRCRSGFRLGLRPDADLQRHRPARRPVDQLRQRPDLRHPDHRRAPPASPSPPRTRTGATRLRRRSAGPSTRPTGGRRACSPTAASRPARCPAGPPRCHQRDDLAARTRGAYAAEVGSSNPTSTSSIAQTFTAGTGTARWASGTT